jgi:hypothetical protein
LYGELRLLKCLQEQCKVVQDFVGNRRANKIINDNIVDDPAELEDAVYALQTTDPKIKQQANTIEKVKKEAKFVAQKVTGTIKSNCGEQQKPASQTSLIQSNEKIKERGRSREGFVHSKSRINIGSITFDETRTGKGRSTSREFSIGNKVVEGRHPELKRIASQLRQSRSSSRLSHEDQLEKREASLNKKFGRMSFGK